MKAFLSNPTEYILNLFGYTITKKPSLLGSHIVEFTYSSWLKDVSNQNRLNDYYIKH